MNANLTGQRDYLLEHLIAVSAFRALPRNIILFGRWIIAPWRANFVLVEPLLRRYYNELPADDGASLFFV